MSAIKRGIDMAAIAIVVIAAIGVGRTLYRSMSGERRSGIEPSVLAEIMRDGHRLGPPSAPVIVVLYTDYACGFCREFHQTMHRALRRYPQHVAFVVKLFVDSASGSPYRVALGAECAAAQGKFREYHDAAFENPATVGYTDGSETLAKLAGVQDLDEFGTCVAARVHGEKLQRLHQEGSRVGVSAVPTLFVNGRVIVGAIAFNDLDAMIASELPKRDRSVKLSKR